MIVEREPKTTAENSLVIALKNGRELLFPPDKKWFEIIGIIADTFSTSRQIAERKLHKIKDNDSSIETTTVGILRMSERLEELDPRQTPQTLICNQEDFRKIIQACDSLEEVEPPRKPRTHDLTVGALDTSLRASSNPRSDERGVVVRGKNSSEAEAKAGSHIAPPKPEHISIDDQESQRPSPFNDYLPNDNTNQPSYHLFKDKQTIRMPREILALNSVSNALSHLANGTLKDTSHDMKGFLEQVAIEHIQLTRFEYDPIQGLLKTILDSDSPKRLNRFFRVTLNAALDLWDIIDTNKIRLKEEKEIIEICNILKKKGYDKEKVTKELLDHFSILPTQKGSNQ